MSELGELTPQLQPKAVDVHPQRPSARCSICQHEHAHTINQMLTGRLLKQSGKRFTFEDIVRWTGLTGFRISQSALSRHKVGHLSAQGIVTSPPPSQRQQGVSKHIRKAAEALVLGIFEEVRAEFAEAVSTAAQGVRVLRESGPTDPPQPPQAISAAFEQEKSRAARGKPNTARTVTRKAKRAMPQDFQSALHLEAALNQIQALPSGMRRPLLSKVAADYGTTSDTVRRWLQQYEQYGLAGITRARRSDKGHARIPQEQVMLISAFIDAHPGMSVRKVYMLLRESQPEGLEYQRRNGRRYVISEATVRRIAGQMQRDAQHSQKFSESSSS